MTRLTQLATLVLLALPVAAAAQDVRVFTVPGEGNRIVFRGLNDRPMIGVTTNQESERADTLGLLVEEVRDDSPAAKAGLKEGDRLQAINGVSLRADRADAGEDDYNGVLNRRLVREIEKAEAGKAVELRVLSDGRTRTVSVTPVKTSELYESVGGSNLLRVRDNRAVIGFVIGSTASARDTLGVFVSAVTTDGPAEKAGIVEGDRIAAINGVSLRVAREDADDHAVGAARANRLRREVARLEAGATVELVVVTAGRSRTVRVTTVQASELPGDVSGFLMPAFEEIRGRLQELPKIQAPSPSRQPMPARVPLTTRTRIVTI